MTNNREEIFQAISKERENQIAQWGGAENDDEANRFRAIAEGQDNETK